MSESKSKTYAYLAAGAGLVVGAALLFNYIAGRTSSSNSLCFEEIDNLEKRRYADKLPDSDRSALLNDANPLFKRNNYAAAGLSETNQRWV